MTFWRKSTEAVLLSPPTSSPRELPAWTLQITVEMTATMSHSAKASLNALPIPTRYGQETFMDPKEIALAIVFLASEKACGINGIVMFVDGGTDALLNTEKVY